MAQGTITLDGRDIELKFNFRVMTQFKKTTGIGDLQRLQEVLTDVEYLPLLLYTMAGGQRAEKHQNLPPVAWWEEAIDFSNYEYVIDTVTDLTVGNSQDPTATSETAAGENP